jgi:hypothetical protein
MFTLLLLVANIRHMFRPAGRLHLYNLVLQCGSYKATATAAGFFYIGTVLQPCKGSILSVLGYIKTLKRHFCFMLYLIWQLNLYSFPRLYQIYALSSSSLIYTLFPGYIRYMPSHLPIEFILFSQVISDICPLI